MRPLRARGGGSSSSSVLLAQQLAAIERQYGGAWEEVKFRGRRPRVGAHLPAYQQIAYLEFRQLELFTHDIDAVAGRTGEHARSRGPGRHQRFDRVGSMFVHRAAVAPVQAII